MSDAPVSLLIVALDPELGARIRDCVAGRDYHVASAESGTSACAAARGRAFDVIVLGVDAASADGIELVRSLRAQAPEAEIVAVCRTSADQAAINRLTGVAHVLTPFDPGQLLATLDRVLEPRFTQAENRRLLWELQVVNAISQVINRSLELEDVLAGALQQLVPAVDAIAGAIRLRNHLTGRFEPTATVGPVKVRQLWDAPPDGVECPSEQVIASRTAVLIEDLAALVPSSVANSLPVRSAISVPMFGSDGLAGTLTLCAARPFRFEFADERLLTIIAGQIAVAVQNARLHESVRRAKREWERTFDAISDPIAVFDSDGLLLRGNAAMAAVLGTPVTEIRRKSCVEIGFCGEGCPDCAVSNALASGATARAEITRADGQIFSVMTFPVAGGAGPSVVQVAKNVTEEIRSARRLRQMSEELAVANRRLTATLDQLKSTQAQLLQAEKLSAIGQLVAGVAHELNNPLTSVIGYAQLLEEELLDTAHPEMLRPPAELASDVRRIAEQSERAARIVRNLLAFARRQTAARAPQDVAELMTRVLSLRGYELRLNSIELRTEFPPHLPPVIGDSGQLQQALLNLVLNAEQAMRGRAARRLSVSARFDAEAGAVELSVSDTGHGIDAANLSRIFDPFFTTREVGEGTGLGLSICYGIVRDHGGQISVTSRVQRGTTFTVLLPARVDDHGQSGEEILVAHADQGERDFVAAALSAWGYPVVAVPRADEALARYARGGLQALLIDRAILAADLTGWSAARTGDAHQVPLILMSITDENAEIERFGREQARAVLAPPFQLRALRSAVRAVTKEYV